MHQRERITRGGIHAAIRGVIDAVACTLAVVLVVMCQDACLAQQSRVPINDLGTGLYLGQYQGGLYPGGSSTAPAAHAAAGIAAGNAIVPRDTAGNVDASGKYAFMSVGMSNTTQEFCSQNGLLPYTAWSFMGQAAASPLVNHSKLAIVNGADGGQSADTWDQATDPNYNRIISEWLTPSGLSEQQVQAAWVKVANPQPAVSLPNAGADARTLVQQTGNIVRSLKTRYPNMQQVFLSSRIYGGYATTSQNPEPYAYESGFAVKWLIEAQIKQMSTGAIDPLAGDLDYSDGTAPWLGWGPYMWADGTNARSDGLTWVQGDFVSDGTHPSTSGEQKVGGMLLETMLSSPYTQSWFVVPEPSGLALSFGVAMLLVRRHRG
jgi:hypothetical protein